jgi:steroid delta-isomerase-like uncharacterized protein
MEETTAKPRTRKPPRRKLVEQHARSYFDALARRDARAMADHWAEDGVEDLVPLRVLRGPAEIEEFFRGLMTAVPDGEVEVTRLVADETRAAVEWRMAGTFTGGPFEGVDPNGRHVELRGFDLLEIEEAKITSNTAYFDGMAFARQVGMLPPQDSGPERAMKNAFNAVTRVRRAVEERTGGRG